MISLTGVVFWNGTMLPVSEKSDSINERTHTDQQQQKQSYIFYGCAGGAHELIRQLGSATIHTTTASVITTTAQVLITSSHTLKHHTFTKTKCSGSTTEDTARTTSQVSSHLTTPRHP